MQNSKLLTATAVFAVAITAAVTTMSLTSAYRNSNNPEAKPAFQMMNQNGTNKCPFYSEERRTAIEEAFTNKDYEAWKALMTENGRNPRITEVITAENFEKMIEIHELMEAGKYEEAQAIKTELGLKGKGGRGGMMKDNFGRKNFGAGCPGQNIPNEQTAE